MNAIDYQMDLLNEGSAAESGDIAAVPVIRVSRRARRLAVRVYPDARVEVVVPPRARPREVESFLAAQREWIETQRAQALRNRPAPEVFPPERLPLALTGEDLRLHLAGGAGRLRVVEKEGMLCVSGAFTPATLKAALRRWLLAAARARLQPRLDALATSTGVPYERLSIRRQRSRWGSCSVRGTISLNACLLFQRPEVVDYLIVHELMHVKHMNHSKRFWQAVEQHCADWRALDRELLQGWRRVPRWIFSDH
ncbi:MAG TPA: SprT family zinc-dependent metalloprotease [Steroidobacteraceae bacterium]